jgi:hypothetical protein
MRQKRTFLRLPNWFIIVVVSGLSSLILPLVVMLLILLVAATLLAPLAQVSLPFSQSGFNGGTTPKVTHEWAGPRNQSVVNAALYVASGLYDGPPDGYDTWYDANKIPDAIAYWQASCPGCAAWAQGNLQCVMLITAAYGLAHQQLPYISNAINFWTQGNYGNRPGWETLSPTVVPYPGDMIVLDSPYFGGTGHIVLVIDIKLPGPVQEGYVQFAEANGPGPLVQMPLIQEANGNLIMGIWRNYTVEGYIRHIEYIT